MANTQSESSFISYPTNRVVGTIADAKQADSVVTALVAAGFDRQSIDVLHGEEGLGRLDPAGTEHGVLERLQRALIRAGAPVTEYKHLMQHVEDIRAGRFVIMVLAPSREQRNIAADTLNAHGAEYMGFFGRWTWRGLTPSSSEHDDTAGDHAHAEQPEDIPRLFTQAWNRRAPETLASLFDSDAEFVNVTGLWWHNRAAIRQAHAYGLERIFNESHLAIDELRVQRLSDNVMVVHAAMALSGQTPIGSISQPAVRKTIFSFVVHRVADRWMCASAQNTDVVPNMETNVIDQEGTVRAANYHTGAVS